MTVEQKHMEQLYTILARQKSDEAKAALRWAIYNLEQITKETTGQ